MHGRVELNDLIPFNYIEYIGGMLLNMPPLRQILPPAPARVLNDLGLPTLERMPTAGDIYTSLPKPSNLLPQLPIPLPPTPPLPFLNSPLPKPGPVAY